MTYLKGTHGDHMKSKISTKLMWLLIFLSFSQTYAASSDILCGIDQFYSKKLNIQSMREQILTMRNTYGTTADIYEELVQLTKGENSNLDDVFWQQYGGKFLNMSISMYDPIDHAIIKLLLEKNVSLTRSPPGEYAPIIAAINFDRYQVLELFFKNGLALSKCQIISLCEYAKSIKKDHIAKLLLQKSNSKKNITDCNSIPES